ncbi:multicopper oxidase family protein [Baaleninema sp.]|uniref:multicopper oxidase family protein n=1 Tax=Baaleninema sp. TaxID=3101197 RepID=UPI003D01BFE5
MSRFHFNRRQFLLLSTSSLGATVLNACWQRQTSENALEATAQPTANKQATSEAVEEAVEVELEATPGTLNLDGRSIPIYTYNGEFPPPRIEAKPGDRVRLRFTNRLDEPTNLHYHGLHVPPTGNADNVFLKVSPGETFLYEFDIPQDHPAGTFYYHPHYHGFVARQVFAGLGGFFIVRGEFDEIPEIRNATETFALLKDFDTDPTGNAWGHMERMRGREGQYVTVNGQLNPTLTFPEGGLLRLRLLNASNARFYRLALEDRPFYLVATDGGAISEPVELQELLLTPGERADILIQGDKPAASFRLLNLPYNRGGMGMMGGRGGGMMGGRHGGMHHGERDRDFNQPQTLATITYAGSTPTQSLPTSLIPVTPLPEPTRVRRFTLSHGMQPGMGMVFLINGKAFDGDRIDTSLQLDDIEDWEITTTGTFDHPFHLHTNPFQVVSRNGVSETLSAWKDVIAVPAGETIRIRVHFRDFAGKTVYHCHILDHEDLGMMGIVEMQA